MLRYDTLHNNRNCKFDYYFNLIKESHVEITEFFKIKVISIKTHAIKLEKVNKAILVIVMLYVICYCLL